MNTDPRLRPGRQKLTRDEVRLHQRKRIFAALEREMSDRGYLHTSVADIIKTAGVSRQTFYELFTSKQDCFVASYTRRQDSLIARATAQVDGDTPMERFGVVLRAYLASMAADPGRSRLYLVGVYAAGDEAIAHRLRLQQQFADAVAGFFEATTDQERFNCRTLVAAVSTMVTTALLDDDVDAVLALYDPVLAMAGRLMA
jgi:TetR/AcrR family transcriptional regulator